MIEFSQQRVKEANEYRDAEKRIAEMGKVC